MKNNPTLPLVSPTPKEEDIREYAFHLYEQSRCEPGHDVDNWLEATACLQANIPAHRSGTRLHRHINTPEFLHPSTETNHAVS
jgi:hypothetical protein